MKKKLIFQAITLIIALLTLASCADNSGKTAVPGKVVIAGGQSDELMNIGYSAGISSAGERASAFSTTYAEPEIDGVQSLSYGGTQYTVKFDSSVKPTMHISGFDKYYVREPKGEIFALYTEHASSKVIGFMKSIDYEHLVKQAAPDEQQLIAVARSGLSEFMDTSYYSGAEVTYDDDFQTACVTFYNDIGGVIIADTSTVEVSYSGDVVHVLAIPNYELRDALNYAELDAASFDVALMSRLSQVYTDYDRNDNEMFATVTYTGTEVQARRLTLEDGRPVVLYYAIPQLNYDITYRGEWASSMTSRGEDVHQTGVYQPPVYAAVYLTDQ